MNTKNTRAEAEALTDEMAQAFVYGAAISDLLKEESVAVAGAALGIALGDWVKQFGSDVEQAEKALDGILAICAKRAVNAQ